jgi:hypothetical protein
MPFTEPIPFKEALERLRQKIPNAKPWSYATWAAQDVDVRERSFFSSKVEKPLFLKRAKLFLLNFLTREKRKHDGKLETSSMAVFVEKVRRLAVSEGMGRAGVPVENVNEGDLQDIRSEARLRLIFQTNIATSYGYGSWRQGMEPAVLDAFPAARVVRNPGAEDERPRHSQEEGNVRLKTDEPYWADYMNAVEIGGFQTPWPPYGFNSFIDQEDVSRSEAERLQLVQKDKPLKGSGRTLPGLNAKFKQSILGLSKEEREKLKESMQGLAVVGPKFARLKTKKEREADAA